MNQLVTKTRKTAAERQRKRKERLASFNIKKIGFLASESQREVLIELKSAGGFSSREETIHAAIRCLAEKYDVSITKIQEEIVNGKRSN